MSLRELPGNIMNLAHGPNEKKSEWFADGRIALTTGAFFLGFVVLDPALCRVGNLSASHYTSGPIVLSTLSEPLVSVGFLLGLGLLLFWKRLAWNGNSAGATNPVRLITSVSCVVIAGSFSFYEYNFWLGSWHLIDRLLLIAFAIAGLINPSALIVFVVQATVVIGQFSDPLGFSWTDKIPLMVILYLAALYQFLRVLWSSLTFDPLFVVFLVAIAAFYMSAGFAKLTVGPWLLHNATEKIILGAWLQNGWLSFLGENGMFILADQIAKVGLVLRVFVMIVELGFIGILFSRRLTIALLVGAIAMHVGILAFTGIFFWKWILLDLAIVVVLMGNSIVKRFFNWRLGLVGAAIGLFFVKYSSRDVPLGWFDTDLVSRYEIELLTADGRRQTAIPKNFAPYDIPMAQGRFHGLTAQAKLVNSLGATASHPAAQAINQLKEGEVTLPELRVKWGRTYPDDVTLQEFEAFLRKWAEQPETRFNSFLRRLTPAHIGSRRLPYAENPNGQRSSVWRGDWATITVIRKLFLVRGTQVEVVDRELVCKIIRSKAVSQ